MKKAFIAASFVPLGLLALPATSHAAPETFTIEPNHTFVHWEVVHFGTSTIRGRWDKKSGSVTIDREAKTGTADIKIDMASVNTGIAKFDEHIKSDEMFNVAKFPEGRFVGKSMKFDGDKVVEVSGDLTLMGVTKPVTLKGTRFACGAHPFVKKPWCGGDFETTIKRSDWGVKYGVPNNSDDTRLLIQIEAIKQD